MQVKWGNVTSSHFTVSNGVRQGGILSPILFNIYMDDLSKELNKCNTGCLVGNSVINHLMYADDLVILSPYSGGLQQLLKVCSTFGNEHDVVYNAKKSSVMIVRTRGDKNLTFPDFHLSGSCLSVCQETKYLGHIFTDALRDDRDISRQCRKLYAQANMLLRKFSMCSVPVKCALFKTFCTPMYTAFLWCSYTKGHMQRLKVAYNDALRILLKAPRWHSASNLFVSCNIHTCEALSRHSMYGFMCRLDESRNGIIQGLVNPSKSSIRVSSRLRKHWRKCHHL